MANTYLARHTGDAFLGQDRSDLHAAAFQGQLMTLYGLILRGADVNRRTRDGVTPLHEACGRGYIYCAEMLIKHGAHLNARNIDGSTPLCDACCYGDVKIVKLLLSEGADPNPPLARTSPLHEAAFRGHTECVEELIKAGSKLEVSDGHYGTALHSACYAHKTDTARALLVAGGNVNAIMNHTGLLHIAASEKTPELVSLLLDFGANAQARNNRNRTPLDLVHETDHETRTILEVHMANPRTLAELCRWQIRSVLGPAKLDRVGKLGLPKIISSFLLYR